MVRRCYSTDRERADRKAPIQAVKPNWGVHNHVRRYRAIYWVLGTGRRSNGNLAGNGTKTVFTAQCNERQKTDRKDWRHRWSHSFTSKQTLGNKVRPTSRWPPRRNRGERILDIAVLWTRFYLATGDFLSRIVSSWSPSMSDGRLIVCAGPVFGLIRNQALR